MIIYIDWKNKKCFIAAPKCGNQTLSAYLNIPLDYEYTDEEINKCLTDNNYQKIIIIRDIVDRFISGFYEDLLNNNCYNSINISFYEYCKFLRYIFDNKIKNVTNLNVYFKNIDANINWGNCSNLSHPITNSNGLIDGHIISLTNSIKNFEEIIQGDNVKIIDINELNNYFIDFDAKINCKVTDIDNTSNYNTNLSEFKKLVDELKVYPIKNNMINEEIKEIIMYIYKTDIDYIHYLKNKYNHTTQK